MMRDAMPHARASSSSLRLRRMLVLRSHLSILSLAISLVTWTNMAIIQVSERQPVPSSERTEPIVDIVAVHGVYEDAKQTWTDPETNVLWLRDLLPRRLPNTRSLLFSYKTETLTSPGTGTADSILAHSTSLVAELCADRQLENAVSRPIIFVCHGLGGLLVKRALVYSSSRRHKAVEHLRSIYTCTYGILFMGTPHNGINKEALLLPQKSSSEGPSHFMISLLEGSEMLNDINDHFAPLMKQFSIYNFWEELTTENGSLQIHVVNQDSAAPSWDNVERCGILASHFAMTKFKGHSDRRYRPVFEALSRYMKNAHKLIQTRWENDISLITQERRQEVEELLQPPREISSSSDTTSTNLNQWCLVPRSPSNYFTGRQKHTQDVRDMFGPIKNYDDRRRNKVLVLYGLGGSGKTQFCLKYVEENKHRYWGVFWVDASNEENCEAAFASIGAQAGRGSNMAAAIYWLSRCTQPWLLILDNADDPDMDISTYCPLGGNGHILVTTRNPSATEHATVGNIRFRGMEPHEAINLLLKAAYPSPQYDSQTASPRKWHLAEGIAIELGYLPLALAHAGATIRRNIYTLERYLHYYLGHRKAMMRSPRVKSADEANIITTWEIPFQKILTRASIEHRDAVDLLHIFAFMHFETIPERVFQRSWADLPKKISSSEKRPHILQAVWNEEVQARFRRAIRILCDHSIIDYDPMKATCAMHPVIHSWARDRLPDEEQKRWLRCTMAVLAECISPYMEVSGRQFRLSLLPHINSCLEACKPYDRLWPGSLRTATEVEKFALVYAEQGLWTTARTLQQKVIQFRTKVLGGRHEATIRARRSLGQTLWNLFDVGTAINTQLQTLATLRWSRSSFAEWVVWPVWKPTHLPYCLALDDLTLTLWLAGQRELSKTVGERAVAGLKMRLGPEDPSTLRAMFNLARTYFHLGEHEKSRELLLWVLRLQKRFFGAKHPDTLMTRNELGINLCASKRHLAAAQRLVENVLQERKQILGDEHAYTLWSINDLSKIYVERGLLNEAVAMLENIIPVVERTLGKDHVGMIMTKSNLAKAYFVAERWTEAEQILLAVLAVVKPGHPDWIHAMYGYAHVQFNMGRMEKAEKHCVEMLDKITKTKILAKDNSRTIAIADLLIRIYRLQDREGDIAAIKSQIPGTEMTSNEDRFDPYAARKRSDTSLPPTRYQNTSSGGEAKFNSSAHRASESRPTPSKNKTKEEPLQRLVARHTF